jgi:hypothetical protein
MNKADITAIIEGIAPVVRGFIEKSVAGIDQRLTNLEGQYKAWDLEALRTQVSEIEPKFNKQLADVLAGFPVLEPIPTIEEIAALVPSGKDGADIDPETIKSMIKDEISLLPPAIPGKDGESIPLETVQRMVDDGVSAAFATVRVPKDGVSVEPEEVKAMVLEAVAALPPATPGKDGISVEPEEVKAMIAEYIAAIPPDLSKATLADCYREIWNVGGEYQRGELVTFGGSLFLALCDTKAKPETNKDWKLIVKRGREGKPGNPRTPNTDPVKVG